MKMIRKLIPVCLLLVAAFAQAQVKQQTSVTVNFTDKEIFLNDSKCFNYTKKDNDFVISDLNGKELIKATIRKNLLGKFESVIMFMNVGKAFSNKKIVGRNDLIFSLLNYHVINNQCGIDIEKLNKFIAENNEAQ